VLTTGTRSVVFVRAAAGALVPREITVGRAAGDQVEVLAGLMAGEIVVSSANFLVDAESNLGMALEGMEMGVPAGGSERSGGYEVHRTPDAAATISEESDPSDPGARRDHPAPASARTPARAPAARAGH
jgi:Cu(I)/Ag(I) efflux system membrane fusion protein